MRALLRHVLLGNDSFSIIPKYADYSLEFITLILERSEAQRRVLQVQVINAFTRKVCKGGEWVMPEAPDPAVGLTPASGAGRTREVGDRASAKFRQGFQQVDP